eukprot:CAMPEP_0174330418 /NCGR_PEP_ID=MMETSP0810-20121108/16666_1 /TAXON_ID=73025 ORGANISM="Eutreptiella gymnastica-like, Strain CCMP1594" /NCGR_SAMPLE_ID=MMETSP0810 /ASSEMBLY_ACC=CAM_ASM_000659 /LENGTH=188 /DNA_ID=CAMNT_0015445583 /DNA_START=104 /DNA_END=670 /DNA_ORIENTATION=+
MTRQTGVREFWILFHAIALVVLALLAEAPGLTAPLVAHGQHGVGAQQREEREDRRRDGKPKAGGVVRGDVTGDPALVAHAEPHAPRQHRETERQECHAYEARCPCSCPCTWDPNSGSSSTACDGKENDAQNGECLCAGQVAVVANIVIHAAAAVIASNKYLDTVGPHANPALQTEYRIESGGDGLGPL